MRHSANLRLLPLNAVARTLRVIVAPAVLLACVVAAPGRAQTLREENISPVATDPAIDQALSAHRVSYALDVSHRSQLFVYLHGLGGSAQGATELVNTAAELGFHSVGITYVNEIVPFTICGQSSSDCYENFRRETIDGVDHSPDVVISPANSVVNRLVKLLQYLDVIHPGEGWGTFVQSGSPLWSSIVVWGHSQGGANAAVLGKHQSLAGLAMSGQATDFVAGQPATWWTGHATQTARIYGFCHVQDQLSAKLEVWDDQGLDDFGPVRDVASTSLPYAGTHQISTSVAPAVSGQYHNSLVSDALMPLNPDGTPVYKPVWRYMLLGALADGSPHLAVCLGDGSEGPCACGNIGAAGHGCRNSFFIEGGRLQASNTASVASDTVVLSASAITGQICLFFQGTVLTVPSVTDDGLGCTAGVIVRLKMKSVLNAASSFPQSGDQPISVVGNIPAAGGTRFYQAFYRNALDYCVPATTNRTNGVAVTWSP